MATISRRPNGYYQATVRRIGFPTQSKTFERKRDAEDWSIRIEADMTRGEHCDLSEVQSTSLAELVQRYLEEVTPEKRGARQEACRIKMLMRHPIAKMRLSQLRSIDFSTYREERKKQVSGKSVREELMIFRGCSTQPKKSARIPYRTGSNTSANPSPILHVIAGRAKMKSSVFERPALVAVILSWSTPSRLQLRQECPVEKSLT